MLQFLPVADGNILAARASGKLSHEDYQNFLPKLEKEIKSLGKISLLLELDNFHGWDLKAAKDDFEFGMQHMDDFDRIAIVGEKAWERWMVAMMKPFVPFGGIRYFDRDKLQQAWDWLREPVRQETAAEQLKPYQSIVAAVDFSIYSKHAAKRAIELARLYKTDLTLLHITEEITPYAYAYDDLILPYPFESELVDAQNKQQIKLAKKRMKKFIDELGDTDGITLHTEVISGDAASAILSFIQAQKIDLIVFGGKKKAGIDKVLGSVPHYIQNRANCEVLVAPFKEAASFED